MANHFRRVCTGAAALVGAAWLAALQGCGGGSSGADGDGDCAQASCVRFVELWSAQFDGVRRNGFSETANASDAGAQSEAGRYLLIGARADGRVRVSARIANPGAVADLVLQFVVQRADGSQAGVGATVVPAGDAAELSLDPENALPAGISPLDVVRLGVRAGIDRNRDGTLDDGEVLATSPWTVRATSASRYARDVAALTQLADNFAATSPADVHSTRFLRAFLGDARAPIDGIGATLVGWDVLSARWREMLQRGGIGGIGGTFRLLSHHVGIDFAADPSGALGAYVFPGDGSLAQAVRASATFRSAVLVPTLQGLAMAADQATSFPTLIAFARPLAARFSDTDPAESDLFKAFGSALFDIGLRATVTCIGNQRRLSGVRLTGPLHDVYDWNADTVSTVPGLPDLFERLAGVQAGFGSLGRAGAVFAVELVLDADLPELDGAPIGALPCT